MNEDQKKVAEALSDSILAVLSHCNLVPAGSEYPIPRSGVWAVQRLRDGKLVEHYRDNRQLSWDREADEFFRREPGEDWRKVETTFERLSEGTGWHEPTWGLDDEDAEGYRSGEWAVQRLKEGGIIQARHRQLRRISDSDLECGLESRTKDDRKWRRCRYWTLKTVRQWDDWEFPTWGMDEEDAEEEDGGPFFVEPEDCPAVDVWTDVGNGELWPLYSHDNEGGMRAVDSNGRPHRPSQLPEDFPERFCGWARGEGNRLAWCPLFEPEGLEGALVTTPFSPGRWAEFAVMKTAT